MEEKLKDQSVRAMKVLWKDAERAGPVTKTNMHSEQLDIAASALRDVRAALERNGTLVPASLRNFQDWKVSLLRRFEAADHDNRSVPLQIRTK